MSTNLIRRNVAVDIVPHLRCNECLLLGADLVDFYTVVPPAVALLQFHVTAVDAGLNTVMDLSSSTVA